VKLTIPSATPRIATFAQVRAPSLVSVSSVSAKPEASFFMPQATKENHGPRINNRFPNLDVALAAGYPVA